MAAPGFAQPVRSDVALAPGMREPMPSANFVTSRGTTIGFLPGYRDMFHQWSASDVMTYPANDEPTPGSLRALAMKRHLDLADVAKTFYTYTLLTAAMRQMNVDLSFPRYLDVGAGTGLHARYFKAQGHARVARSIDNRPAKKHLAVPLHELLAELRRRRERPRGYMARGIRAVKRRAYQAAFSHARAAVEPPVRTDTVEPLQFVRSVARERRFLSSVPGKALRFSMLHLDADAADLLREQEDLRFAPWLDSIAYDYRVVAPVEDDGYIVGNVYDVEEQHDLITTVGVLQYFDLPRIFAKISSMLAPGGVFVLYENYWWYPLNGMKAVGDFPFTCQRLDRDDLLRYFRHARPDASNDVEQMLQVYGTAYTTVGDYEQHARTAGLDVVGARRLRPRYEYDHRLGERKIGGLLHARLAGCSLDDIVAEVRRHKPDVVREDLQTSHVIMVFRKP